MKKFFSLFFILFLATATYQVTWAQGEGNPDDTTSVMADDSTTTAPTADPDPAPAANENPQAPTTTAGGTMTAHQQIKKYFIDGGWQFMTLVLICLILGLAVAIERIITLSLSTVNTRKLLTKLEASISNGDINGAREICKSTAGPTAEVLGEGLRRTDEGIDAVEKAIVSNGSVQMGLLEKGLVWLALFIALAPMLGFMGTVLGMIEAFDKIEKAGDIRPSDVAGGIKIALLTTVFGLITAIILQIFYNFITSKVDNLVNTMEDATISLVDMLIDHNAVETNSSTGSAE
ncbi:MAG: MotA/TolQ/ExbB proton channel family protein [Saprospiraceae bacterium]|nr:MotA/TolQ/ExbB proton channel family protein [Saprospiraceae bacterium]